MQFSWTTFIVEMINFLILVWILKRLLFVPIKRAILQRQQSIQEKVDQANELNEQAKKLEEKYANRLKDWEIEKDEKKKKLHQEMLDLKNNELEKIHQAIDQEKEKSAAIASHQLKQEKRKMAKEALNIAADFSSKFLKHFADEAIESKIITLFVNDLSKLTDERRQLIQTEIQNEESIAIQSAYDLNKEQQQSIKDAFNKIINKPVDYHFDKQSELLAGINVQIGAVNLQADLRDELQYFAEVSSGSIQD